MTHASKPAPRTAATCPGPRAGIPAAALAALLLAGCSTGHIGESWQCPLAEGGLCDSVAAADPAVPDPDAAKGTVLVEPLWRVRAAETETSTAREPALPAQGRGQAPAIRGPGQSAQTACPAGCDGGFDPFAWLARLFAAEAHEGDARRAGGSVPAPSASVAQPADPASGGMAAAPAAARSAEPEADPLPAEAGPVQDEPAEAGPSADDLRTGEILARIWIAPFVDADGVYREASHVRVVLEPAGWRLP